MLSSVLLVFWRMHGAVQRHGTIALGRETYESGLRDRPADHEYRHRPRWLRNPMPSAPGQAVATG
jgi:hypothetical protein